MLYKWNFEQRRQSILTLLLHDAGGGVLVEGEDAW